MYGQEKVDRLVCVLRAVYLTFMGFILYLICHVYLGLWRLAHILVHIIVYAAFSSLRGLHRYPMLMSFFTELQRQNVLSKYVYHT